MEQSTTPTLKRKFAFEQYYSVLPDPAEIDKHYETVHADDPETRQAIQEERQRMHRLFQAIVTNEKALQAVMVYQVIVHHGVEYGGTNEELCGDYYRKEDIDFFDILRRVADCFSPEDRAWLAHVAATEDDSTELYLLFEGLQNCFEVKWTGWAIGPMSTVPARRSSGQDVIH